MKRSRPIQKMAGKTLFAAGSIDCLLHQNKRELSEYSYKDLWGDD